MELSGDMNGRITVPQENEHIEQLMAARISEVAQRRQVVKILAGEYRRGHTEDMRNLFIAIQTAIDCLDRAIKDEEASNLSEVVDRMDEARRLAR